MSYLHDRKKDRLKKRFLLSVILVVLLVLLSVAGLFKGLGGLMHIIAKPFWKSTDMVNVAVDGSVNIVKSKSTLEKENYNLDTKVQELQNAMLDYDILKKENEDLKALMDRKATKDEFILATILTKPNRSPYDTVVVDIGLDHNLQVGQHVFANAVTPIGRVFEVYARTALVKLYSTPGEVTEAQVEGSNASIELTGRGGGNFEMMIPHDMEIVSGTNVIIPNINSRILAVVADVVSDPRDPLKKVILHSPINIQDLKWVEILK
jgi:cell shape-determining protein MreC